MKQSTKISNKIQKKKIFYLKKKNKKNMQSCENAQEETTSISITTSSTKQNDAKPVNEFFVANCIIANELFHHQIKH